MNPFEETFRQAIDCKAKRPSVLLTTQKSLEVIKSNDEDTLHTPHIIPYNTIADNKDNSTKCDTQTHNKTEKESPHIDKKPIVIVTNESTATDLSVNNNDKEDIKTIVECRPGPTPSKTLKIVNKKPNDDMRQKIFRKIYPKPIVPLTSCVSNPVKGKIRESLLKLRTILPDDKVVEAKVPIDNSHIPPSKKSDNQNIPKVETKPLVHKRNAVAVTTTAAAISFQDNTANERNREAAKRYRNKQKMLHDALQERNKQLEAENAMLKKQLYLFKKAHANCSVSLYQI